MFNIARSVLIFLWSLPFICTILSYTGHWPNSIINYFYLRLLFVISFLSASFLFLEWFLALRTVIGFNKTFKYLRDYNLTKLDKTLKKVPISKCFENGSTLLKYAIDHQMRLDIVTFLLSKGGLVTYSYNKEYNISYTLFYLASYYNFLNEKIVNYLLNKGAYVDFIDNSRGFNSLSLLQVFVLRCHLPIVELLINKGTNLHYIVPDLDMNTLMLAAKYINNTSIIKLLAEKGGNINQENSHGYKPILFAAEYNPSPEVIYCLVKLGAKIEPYKVRGTLLRVNTVTPLRLAVAHNNIDIVNTLINLGDNVNFKDLYGFSILFIAAAHNTDVRVIKLLLESGAQLDQANDTEENTPLMGAAYLNSSVEVINFLIRISGNLNKRNNEGLNFLDYLRENTSLDNEYKQLIINKFLH